MSTARAHDALVGRTLGEFVLRERIGEGGFGAVYRAVQPALDREAVVKVMHGKLRASPAASERFLREAKLASKLDHPYAAHIYAFGVEAGGESWIAMELVRGTPLDRILQSQGPLPLERFVPLLDRVCEVVHTAHEQGIVHRDLKPANVMVLARAGRLLPKLLDFGIAKGLERSSTTPVPPDDGFGRDHTVRAATAENDDAAMANTIDSLGGIRTGGPALTQVGAIMGSPPYMAPEQWVDAGLVDGRTDLYALAILAYECLTGRPPFVAKNVTQMAMAHAREAVPPLGPKFPAALDKVFAKALAKEPDGRYADALALATAFRQAAGVAAEAVALPTIDPKLRDAAVSSAPQPIAEAIAAIDAARNPHQAHGAIVAAARTIARYLGLVALACRSRVSGGDDPAGVAELIRALSRGPLADKDWLALARALARSWQARRDAYPLPEMVDAFTDDTLANDLAALLALRDRELAHEDAVLEQLEGAVVQMSRVLRQIAFLGDYPLVVPVAAGVAERWVGQAPRTPRATMMVRGKGLANGAPALVDAEGVPALSLSPLIVVAPPTPGAALELFLFEGKDARGGKLVALPAGFELHDDTVVEWLRAQLEGSIDEAADTFSDDHPPYRGLSSFSVDDGAQFFGREQLVDAFVNRMKLQPLLAVVGRSGAGKSSFVHAGVIPALPAGWRTVSARPGSSPLRALLARLEHAGLSPLSPAAVTESRDALGEHLRADAARRGPLAIVIDQLEEMFTLCSDDDERRVFSDALATAARSADDPVRVIFTLRDDFLVRTEQLVALRNRIGQGLQLLTVPGPDDLTRIVVEPARRAGYELEGELAADMVREVAGQPGALALLSFTAQKLWELRDRHFKQLTRAAYKSLGGVAGALAKHADITLDALPPEQRALAREAFRHLVTSQGTRAVLARKDLRAVLGSDEASDRVIETLVSARLLVATENESGAETIEIVHEALLSAWPRLVEWQHDDAEGARFREQLRAAAEQWHERSRPKGLLWRGEALGDYTRWRARHPGPLTELEAAFAGASEADALRGRRLRRSLLAAAFASLVAVVIALVALNARIAGQRAVAEDANSRLQANLRTQYENQGRRLLLDHDPLQALAYFAKAQELGAHGPAHDFLVGQTVQEMSGAQLELVTKAAARSPRFSTDGSRLITGSIDGTARIWDAHSGALLLELPHADSTSQTSLSRDGATALTASYDGAVTLWDATSGKPLQRLQRAGLVRCAEYAPDGTYAVVTSGDEIALWNLSDGTTRARLHDGTDEIMSCAFSFDGRLLATGDAAGTTRLWDTRDGQLLHTLSGQHDRTRVAFSPDGTRVITASLDGTVIEWRASDGTRLLLLSHHGGVRSAEFSPDGRWIVSASTDHTATVWDAATGEPRFSLEGHAAQVNRASYSPDGRYIATISEDTGALLWDAATGHPVARWHGHEGPVADLAFDTSGTRLATASDDGRVIVWNVAPQEQVTWLRGHTRDVLDARFAADGRRVVTASVDGTARVWDVATGRELRTFGERTASINGAAFSADGSRVVTSSLDGSVRVWDVEHASVVMTLVASSPVKQTNVDWSPDGKYIAMTTSDGWLRCWDAPSGRLRFEHQFATGTQFFSVNFDTASRQLITTSIDHMTRFWSLDGASLGERRHADLPLAATLDPSGQRVLSPLLNQRAKIWNPTTGATEIELVGHVGIVEDARWSPDGRWAITAGSDHTVRIWDADTGDVLSVLSHPSRALTAAFSPDGSRVVVAYEDGAAVYTLQRRAPDAKTLAHLLACQTPFEIRDNRIVARARATAGCSETR